ncbi:MAG: hypothetical protein CVU47_12905 [Chloroflexi bacterium HGW-Chloroflexi-9]|nr:MAG: hypothetical protein CVU47_12905 [Chloroflexi bacterium HGW-Chloroflexi-9]
MPVATYVASEPLGEQAEFLVLLKEADGSAVAAAPVHLRVTAGHLRSDGRGVGGGARFIWVGGSPGAVIEASSARGATLAIRRL